MAGWLRPGGCRAAETCCSNTCPGGLPCPLQVLKELVAEEAHQKPASANACRPPRASGKHQAQQQAEAVLEVRNAEQQQQPQQQQALLQRRLLQELLEPAVVYYDDLTAAAANKASSLAAISQNTRRQHCNATKGGGALEAR